jgi:putative ABC transport system permease protein
VLVGFFAVLAALIASGGIYAVISYVVGQAREFGVHVALGATRQRIASTVLARGLRVTGIGSGVGSLLTTAAGRLLVWQVPGLQDAPWMLAAVAALLVFLTLLAESARRRPLGIASVGITAMLSDFNHPDCAARNWR